MNYQINTKVTHENIEGERWIIEVHIVEEKPEEGTKREDTFLVYVDADEMSVRPPGYIGSAERTTFQWADWIFANSADVISAAVIAALAVFRQP